MDGRDPRVAPIEYSDWDAALHPLRQGLQTSGLDDLSLMKTLANHPDLMRRYLVFGNHVMSRSSLPARERELIILRTSFVCGSGYEWLHHLDLARQAGLNEDVGLIAAGAESPHWSQNDRLLLRAVDEQIKDFYLCDDTWAALAARWDQQQLMDIVFTVGQYTMLAMALRVLEIPLEENVVQYPPEMFPDGRFIGGPSR